MIKFIFAVLLVIGVVCCAIGFLDMSVKAGWVAPAPAHANSR
jgi:hypothetical protein